MLPTPSPSTEDKVQSLTNHFVWLDWLRFIAAFIVMATHARFHTWLEFGQLESSSKTILTKIFFALTRIGHEAVIVFFVLSGFLVGGKVIERVSKQTFNWRSYAVDRSSRILVPMLPAIILTVAIDMYFGLPFKPAEVFGNLFFLQGIVVMPMTTNAPLWSLSYEVWFYVLAAALAVAVMRRPTPTWPALLILLVTLIIFTKLVVLFLFCWSLGALVYLYPRDKFSAKETSLSAIIIVIAIMMVQLSSQTNSIQLGKLALLADADCGDLLLSAGIALLVRNLCTLKQNAQNTTSLGRLGTHLAAFSYTLYLVHSPVLQAIQYAGQERSSNLSMTAWSMYALRMAACLVVSYVLYWLFERNTPVVRRFLQSKFLQKKTAVSAKLT